MENKRNEMDELFKSAMQFEKEPLPDEAIRLTLRKKVEARKKNKAWKGFVHLLNFNVKLYQAGIAVAAVALVLILLKPMVSHQQMATVKGGVEAADTASTGNCNSLKQDSFLVRNFSTSIY